MSICGSRSWLLALVATLSPFVFGGELPLLFERHSGTTYRVRGNGYSIHVDEKGLQAATKLGVSSLRWVGAGKGRIEPGDPLTARVNYLLGADRSAWRTGLPTYGRLAWTNAYPGVSLVFYGHGSEFEYDVILQPGASPESVRFSAEGDIDEAGDLRLSNGLRWKRPVASQDGRSIDASFVERGPGLFGFKVGPYDPSRILTIDPVLTYGTYLGGSLGEEGRGIAADAQGNAYIVGYTESADFPGTTRGQIFGTQDIFIAKLNDSGRAIVWATYLGGNSVDTGNAIAVDSTGAVYVTGQTASTNFPVSENAPQRTLAGGSGVTDSFVTKLSPDGSNVVFSTYLGGSQSETANAITLDSAQAVYVAGRTDSVDFPITTRDVLPPRGGGDAFVVKLTAQGALAYATVLGGFGLDVANGIAVDAAGAAHVTGETRSDNFPVSESAYQRTRNGNADAFLTKLNAAGNQILFSTYYGGESQEVSRCVALDTRGNVYIAGSTNSLELPVSFGAVQRAPVLLPEAFVAKFDSLGQSLVFGTYLGGNAEDEARAISVDANGSTYVTGFTNSTNFPTLNDGPLTAQSSAGGLDGFITKVSAGGNSFSFSTHFGGTGSDRILASAVDGRGRIWIAGVTDSSSLPTTAGALSSKLSGPTDAFVALLSEITVIVSPGAVTLGPRESQQFTALVSNTANRAVRWSIFPDFGAVTDTGLYTAPSSFDITPVVILSAISAADATKVGEATIRFVNRITISVGPAEVSLRPGQTQQFTAVVAGTQNTAVTWSVTPQIGTISSTGLYTAPASLIAATTITLRATSVADSARTATATINLLPPLPPPNPAITAEGVANAASFRGSLAEGGIAAGQLITLFGTAMGPASAVTLQLDGRGFVSNRLGGTRVLFDGTPGAMISSSAGQVSVVVPYEVEGRQNVEIRAEYEGRLSNAITMPVAAAAPGIFTAQANGRGSGAVIRQNGQLVTSASAGEALTLFGTGEGATDPAGIDGKPTTSPLPRPKQPVKVVIDGVDYDPLYAGGAPGLVAGVLQVNFTVPQISPGVKRLQLRVGGRLSPDLVTLEIR